MNHGTFAYAIARALLERYASVYEVGTPHQRALTIDDATAFVQGKLNDYAAALHAGNESPELTP